MFPPHEGGREAWPRDFVIMWLFQLVLCRFMSFVVHSVSPFALGCGVFISGFCVLGHSERREVGGALVAPSGGPSCLFKRFDGIR